VAEIFTKPNYVLGDKLHAPALSVAVEVIEGAVGCRVSTRGIHGSGTCAQGKNGEGAERDVKPHCVERDVGVEGELKGSRRLGCFLELEVYLTEDGDYLKECWLV